MKNVRKITMNKTLLVLIGLTLGVFMQACGTDDEPVVTPTTRTVNKSLLNDKDWNRNGSTWYVFDSDGTWNENGTWKWLGDNDSDSMEVINTRSVRSVLYFEYIEAKEMKCGTMLPGGAVYTSP
jgi:hypothetical protein